MIDEAQLNGDLEGSVSDKSSLESFKFENYMQLDEYHIKEAINMYIKFKIDKARFPHEQIEYAGETNYQRKQREKMLAKQRFIQKIVNKTSLETLQSENVNFALENNGNTHFSIPVDSGRVREVFRNEEISNNLQPFRSVNQTGSKMLDSSQ